MKGSVLVVDDEKLIRWTLQASLRSAGYEVTTAETGGEALRRLGSEYFDVVLLDYKLPDINGLEVLRQMQPAQDDTAVIMITAHSSVDHAVEAIQAGARDYLAKPFRNEDIILRVEKVLENAQLRREVGRYRAEDRKYGTIIGESPPMKKVFRLVDRLIESPPATLLIQGESGTGKDVLAKAIHFGGPRRDAPYMNITCTAIPETLLESELFGHEKGAFTDARTQKKGLVELANNGTLFLDEIGDMSAYLQAKLLRFLEERSFRRVGGGKDIEVDVRVVAATNKDLKKLVEEEKFREDLYFRLKVIPIQLPPLRERVEDIPLLVQHFVDQFNREFKKSVTSVSPQLMTRLKQYQWPGNIRELRNTIERAMILGDGDQLREEDLPLDLFDEPPRGDSNGCALKLTKSGINLEELERDLVRQALQLTRGNQTRAGRLLKINRDQVRYRIEKFGLHDCLRPEDEPGQ